MVHVFDGFSLLLLMIRCCHVLLQFFKHAFPGLDLAARDLG